MKNNIVFIHIPKTGGTTINTAMQQAYWQTKPDFYYRHILSDTKKSNCGDIFEESNFNKYSHFDVIMMLRHPVDRAISEYYFMKERKEFMKLLQAVPKNLNDFVNNRQTHNYVVSFLTGERIYSKKRPQVEDLERIKKAIDTIPIHVGIFEQYAISLDFFSRKTGIEWKKKVEVKRMTFIRPKVEEVSDDTRERIMQFNALDAELYDYCLNKFNKEKDKISTKKIKFDVNKYNHVLPYMANYPFFEFCMENKNYINKNITLFKQLSRYLIDEKKINDGLQLTKSWNATYLNYMKCFYPETGFYRAILEAYKNENEPLEQTAAMAKAIDHYLKKNKKDESRFCKQLPFDAQYVIIPKIKFKQLFKHFLSK